MSKTLSWAASDAARPFGAVVLHLAAAALQAASHGLTRLAERLSVADAASAVPVHLVEFHSLYRESGAPEGALYINGELVGVLSGVTRL